VDRRFEREGIKRINNSNNSKKENGI